MTEGDRLATSVPDARKESYEAGCAWVRSCNSYIWELARIFVPLSLGAAVLAINPAQALHKTQLCIASFSLASFWWLVAASYAQSTVRARRVLMKIEEGWGLDPSTGHYLSEEQLAYRGLGVYTCLVFHACLLAALWFFICTQ